MTHREPTDEIRATAALYSLGALPPEEARAFEEHLAGGCEVCRAEARSLSETAANLALGVAEATPRGALRDRLLAQIPQAGPRMHVVRTGEGKWRPAPFPGVSVKTLFFDRETAMATNLVRMEPGASYPPHRHTAVEQCLVLEGDVRLDDAVLGPGDYSRNDAFSDHDKIHTVNGCLLLIISSMKDELLA